MDADNTVTDSLETAVAGFIDAEALIEPGAGIVVAVSGGADSVALLAILHRLAKMPQRQYTLYVAHLDHAIRPTSHLDAEFVARMAQDMSLPVFISRQDAKNRSEETGQSVETAGRELRYAFLAQIANEVGAKAVALGHHADDNVETALHRLARGSGLRGMAGIPPERPLPGTEAWVVRPLIRMRRDRIEDYCRRHHLEYRSDQTNNDTTITRNFIRHELLPQLRDRINPEADTAILRFIAAAREAEAYLSSRAVQALENACVVREPTMLVLDRRSLRARSLLMQKYAMRIALDYLGVPMGQLDSDHLHALSAMLAGKGKGVETLPGHFSARRQGPSLVIEYIAPGAAAPPAPNHDPVPIAVPGRTVLPDGTTVSVRTDPADVLAFQAHCRDNQPGVELLNASRIRGGLLCRPRRDGDSFIPLGCDGTQTVGDLLTNVKAPPEARNNTWCLCDDDGIVYVPPYRIADRVKITDDSRHYLRIEFIPRRS